MKWKEKLNYSCFLRVDRFKVDWGIFFYVTIIEVDSCRVANLSTINKCFVVDAWAQWVCKLTCNEISSFRNCKYWICTFFNWEIKTQQKGLRRKFFFQLRCQYFSFLRFTHSLNKLRWLQSWCCEVYMVAVLRIRWFGSLIQKVLIKLSKTFHSIVCLFVMEISALNCPPKGMKCLECFLKAFTTDLGQNENIKSSLEWGTINHGNSIEGDAKKTKCLINFLSHFLKCVIA